MKLDRSGYITIAAVLGAAVVLALLNQMTATGSAVHVPTYVVALAGKYLCFAMLALAVDLVWGFAGILSLGQSAFLGLGGYAYGIVAQSIGGGGGSLAMASPKLATTIRAANSARNVIMLQAPWRRFSGACHAGVCPTAPGSAA